MRAPPPSHVNHVDFSNIGVWRGSPGGVVCGIRTPWGNLELKPVAARLRSEVVNDLPYVALGDLCLTWTRLRRRVVPARGRGR